ncbi:MAG: ComEC/Rec2 family competence protein [Chitinophagaceae bacterium]|nr:ComEC/Rec2 family competence protein [Chitinophagaceae bacterium]
MPRWKQIPFVRVLPAFLTGILQQWYLPVSLSLIARGLFAALLPLVLFAFLRPGLQFQFRWLPVLAIHSLLMITGSWVMALQQRQNGTPDIHVPESVYTILLERDWKQGPKSFKNQVRLWQKDRPIRAWLYTPKDSAFLQLPRGSWIQARVSPRPISPPVNPGSFDYKSYSLHQGITHQVYLKSDQYRLLQKGKTVGLARWLEYCRQRVLEIMRQAIPGKQEAGLAEALFIGYKDDLDKDMEAIYAQTGVVHIIAISGMHLGLIYGLLLLLFKPLKNHTQARWVRALLIIAALWLFSLLAGGSPSVLRSAVMFTAILFGEAIHRKGNAINSLAFAAFALLCYKPYWLGDIGFQLSFAAVLSILVFYPLVYRLFYFRQKWMDAFWKLNAVTLSAQVLTFPLCVYHFHQFPTWFLAANLVAVPLSNIILLGEIGLCALASWDWATQFTGFILYHLIRWMTMWVSFVNQWPFSIWEPLFISWSQTILLYLLIVIPFLPFNRIRKISCFLFCLMLFMGESTYRLYQSAARNQLIIYSIHGKRAMDIQTGRTFQFLGDTGVLSNKSIYSFHIRPCRIQNRIANEKKAVTDEISSIKWKGKTIGFLSNKSSIDQLPTRLDLLVISHDPTIDPDEVLGKIQVKMIVLDASNSYKTVRRWKENGVSVWDVREGSYVYYL